MLPSDEILRRLEHHTSDVRAITAILRERPDLVAYAQGTLHDLGGRVEFEITQVLYACVLQPDMFDYVRSALEDFKEAIPPEHHPAKPIASDQSSLE
jgi:hypothetical protein